MAQLKRPKKLSRRQRELCSFNFMNADDWLLLEEMEFYIRFINKATGKVRYVDFNELSIVDLEVINAFTGIGFEINNGKVTKIVFPGEEK